MTATAATLSTLPATQSDHVQTSLVPLTLSAYLSLTEPREHPDIVPHHVLPEIPLSVHLQHSLTE